MLERKPERVKGGQVKGGQERESLRAPANDDFPPVSLPLDPS